MICRPSPHLGHLAGTKVPAGHDGHPCKRPVARARGPRSARSGPADRWTGLTTYRADQGRRRAIRLKTWSPSPVSAVSAIWRCSTPRSSAGTRSRRSTSPTTKLKLATRARSGHRHRRPRREPGARCMREHGGADVAIGLGRRRPLPGSPHAYAGLRRGGRLVLVALPASGRCPSPSSTRCSTGRRSSVSIVGTRRRPRSTSSPCTPPAWYPGELRDQAARRTSTRPSPRCCTARRRHGWSSSRNRPGDRQRAAARGGPEAVHPGHDARGLIDLICCAC